MRARAQTVARGRPLSIGKAKRIAMFTPNVTDTMPACSDGAATEAGAVYAYARHTVILTPGMAWNFVATPELGCLGYASESVPGSYEFPFINESTLIANPVDYSGLGPTNAVWQSNGCVGNVPRFTTATSQTGPYYDYDVVRYSNDPFQQPGSIVNSTDESNAMWQYLGGEMQAEDESIPPEGVWDLRRMDDGNETLVNCETGTVEIEVTLDWNANAEVYHVGSNTSNLILGPRTTRTVNNDGDPTDSTVYCNNPVVAGFSNAQIAQGNAPYNTLSDGLSNLLTPEFLTGTQRKTFTIDLIANSHDQWQRMGSSKFPPSGSSPLPIVAKYVQNDGTTPVSPDEAFGQGAPSCYNGAAVCPPFIWASGGDRELPQLDMPSGQVAKSGSISQAYEALKQAYITRPTQYGKLVCGMYQVRNISTEGTVRISLTGKMRYNVQNSTQSQLVQLNRPCLPFTPPIDPTLMGHAGSGLTAAHARTEVAANTIASAQQRGIPLDPEVKSALVKCATKPIPRGQASGPSPTASIASISDGVEAVSSLAKATVVPALGLVSSDLAAGASEVINTVDSVLGTVGRVAEAVGPFAELFSSLF